MWILKSRKKYGVPNRSCDPAILPTREKGPEKAFFMIPQYYSKTQMDKNQTKTPTREGEIRQQKSRLLKSGFLNGRGGGIPLRYFY